MHVYLHETIDIRGDGTDAYLRAVLERAHHSETYGMSRLVGTWRVIGSTHRWPRVVNLWEMDGWAHWASTLERQFVPGKKDPHLEPWWREMTRFRRGGFDRILLPAPFSPTCIDLRSSGQPAAVCEQTWYRGPAGVEERLLDEVAQTLEEQRERQGVRLAGAYRAAMRSGEALVMWFASSFAALCAEREALMASAAWRAWQQRLRHLGVRWETLWLAPPQGVLLGGDRNGGRGEEGR